jgi:hypothetical protein
MSSCTQVANRLAELAALSLGELPPRVREHLGECASCARALWAQRIMQETLEDLLVQRRRCERGRNDGHV